MSVYKRTNGIYESRFMLKGRMWIKSTKTKNKRDAEVFDRQHRASVYQHQMLGGAEPIALGEAFNKFLTSRKECSVELTQQHIRRLGEFFKQDHIHQIQTSDIHRFIEHRRQQGKANNTIRISLSVLRGAAKIVKQQGYKTSEIIWPVDEVKSPPKPIRFLTIDEEKRLLNELSPKQGKGYNHDTNSMRQDLYDLVCVMLDTGCRIGEICRMKWTDLDFDKKTMGIFRKKSHKPDTLCMTTRCFNVLSVRLHTSTWVFPNKKGDGGRLVSSVLGLKRACVKAGLPDISSHNFRKTFGSRLVKKGFSIYQLSKLLGHSNVNLTQSTYAHLSIDDGAAEAARLLESSDDAG